MLQGPDIENFDPQYGMLANYEFEGNCENISHTVTLVPRLQYSVNLLTELIVYLSKKRQEIKKSNKSILSKFDESDLEYRKALELEGIITFSLEALCYVEKRTQSISGATSIPEKLTSLIPMLRMVSAKLYGLLPECSHKLGELSVHLGSIVLDSATLTRASFDFGKLNHESSDMLDEVKLIADSKMCKQYPNLDFLKLGNN